MTYETIFVLYDINRKKHNARVYVEFNSKGSDNSSQGDIGYIVVDYKTGRQEPLNSTYAWSPSGNRFAGINYDEDKGPNVSISIGHVVPGGIKIDYQGREVECPTDTKWKDENKVILIDSDVKADQCIFIKSVWNCKTLDTETAVKLGYIKPNAKKSNKCDWDF
jgi:hypothetical protein